jgi:outer membrane protein assembly factor BamB
LYVGSYDGYFYAIDVTTGNEKWKFATKGSKEPISTEAETGPVEGSPGAIVSSPAISKGVVYFGSTDDHLYALDANTGKEKWEYKTEYYIAASPAISDGVIYFGSQDGYFYAIDDTGQLIWKFDTKTYATISSPPGGTPFFSISSGAVSNGIIYFASDFDSYFGRQDYLFAVDTKSGEMKWKDTISKAGYGAPTVSNELVYFGDDDGFVFAIDAETGQTKWKFQADSKIVSDIVMQDGLAYFCSEGGYLYALR